MVGSFSKWYEVEVMRSIDTQNTINTWRSWFSKYGLPNESVTDSGTMNFKYSAKIMEYNITQTLPTTNLLTGRRRGLSIYIY